MTNKTQPQEFNPAGNAVTGNFTLTATLPQGKQVTFSGYLYDGESIESVNGRIDLLHDAMDRQRTRAEIPELEVVLESKVKRLDELKGHYSAILAKKERAGKLNPQEKAQLDVMDINLKHNVDDIAQGRSKIVEARAKVGM